MTGILITGGAGFIGSHTALFLLQNGFDVVVIDSLVNSFAESIDRVRRLYKSSNSNKKNNIYFFNANLCNFPELEKVFQELLLMGLEIDAVLHFAGFKSVSSSFGLPGKYWFNNITSTMNLLLVMKKYKCKSMVFSSSASVYGKKNKSPLKEEYIPLPNNPYSETKLFIENMLKNEANLNGMRIASLRYFNPIGAHYSSEIGEYPKEKPNNIFPILNMVAKGEKSKVKIYGNNWLTSDGTCIRDYIHVMDLAEAHFRALELILENKLSFINLNIGTGKGTSVLELINTYEEVNKVNLNYTFKSRRLGDVAILYADTTLSKKILNWFPSRSLKDMCKDGWEWVKRYPKGYDY